MQDQPVMTPKLLLLLILINLACLVAILHLPFGK